MTLVAATDPAPSVATTDRPAIGGRVVAFDLLRGYLLFMIVVDHLQFFPGGYDLFTGRAALFASAAEGFFFLSGMMVWLARGRLIPVLGFRQVAVKLWRRAGQLYLLNAVLTLGFTAWAFALDKRPGTMPGVTDHEELWPIVHDTLLLRYSYGWADFLPHYAIFMAIAPLAVYLAYRRMWWVVFGASAWLWATSGSNFRLGWQFLFFSGLVVGRYWNGITAAVAMVPKAVRRYLLGTAVATSLVTLAWSIMLSPLRQYFAAQIPAPFATTIGERHARLAPWFDTASLPVPRLYVFMLWFGTALAVSIRFEKVLTNTVGRFFVPLGRNSLYVYVLHSVVVYGLHVLGAGPKQPMWNFFMTTVALFALWLAVRTRFLFTVIPR